MRLRVWLLIAIFIVDRFTKSLIWFSDPESLPALLRPVLNTDIAFSVALPYTTNTMLIGVLVLIIAAVAFVTMRDYRAGKPAFFWWGIILCGAASNLLDRLQLGGVLDYLSLGFWPVFNLSDAAIAIGTAVLIFREIRSHGSKNAA